jgi:uncharacterized protein YecT (DUF1311 family)
MTDQEHIDAIGAAINKTENAVKTMRKALKQTEKSLALLHARMDRAQKAYIATRDGDNIVAFSGGSNKPTEPDPDEGP